jgi:predicted small secreted protein
MKKPIYLPIVVLSALLLLTACATTRLTGVWHDKNYQGGPIKSIMVVGVARTELRRNIFESALVNAFEAQGVRAVPSRKIMGEEAISNDTVMAAAKKADVQAVLITRVMGTKKQKYYYPPVTYAMPGPYYYGNTFYPYQYNNFHYPYNYTYPYPYPYIQNPGYVQTYKSVDLETNIYGSENHQLIWSAASQSFDPENVNDVVNDLAKLFIKELKHNKLI